MLINPFSNIDQSSNHELKIVTILTILTTILIINYDYN